MSRSSATMRKFRLTTTSRVARARRFYAWGPSLSGDADEYNLQTHASRKPTNYHLTLALTFFSQHTKNKQRNLSWLCQPLCSVVLILSCNMLEPMSASRVSHPKFQLKQKHPKLRIRSTCQRDQATEQPSRNNK